MSYLRKRLEKCFIINNLIRKVSPLSKKHSIAKDLNKNHRKLEENSVTFLTSSNSTVIAPLSIYLNFNYRF